MEDEKDLFSEVLQENFWKINVIFSDEYALGLSISMTQHMVNVVREIIIFNNTKSQCVCVRTLLINT